MGDPAISPGEEDFGCHHANTAGHADSGGLWRVRCLSTQPFHWIHQICGLWDVHEQAQYSQEESESAGDRNVLLFSEFISRSKVMASEHLFKIKPSVISWVEEKAFKLISMALKCFFTFPSRNSKSTWMVVTSSLSCRPSMTCWSRHWGKVRIPFSWFLFGVW